jgi:hypothetical protein
VEGVQSWKWAGCGTSGSEEIEHCVGVSLLHWETVPSLVTIVTRCGGSSSLNRFRQVPFVPVSTA